MAYFLSKAMRIILDEISVMIRNSNDNDNDDQDALNSDRS